MTEAYAQVLHTVDQVRRAWRSRRIVEGLAQTLAVGTGMLVVLAAIDDAAMLGPVGRWAAGLALWLSVAAVAWQSVARPAAAGHSDDYFAVMAEQRLGLGNRLINAVQLGREPVPAAPRLVDAIVADGVRATDEFDPGPVVASPALGRYALALLGVLVIAAAYLSLGGPPARSAAARVLLPFADIQPFTWTSVSVQFQPGTTVLEGQPLTVTLTTAGRPVDHATLHLASDAGPRRSLRLQPDRGSDPAAFTHTFAGLDRSIDLHATAGDGRLASHRITVVPRPRPVTIESTYRYPDYTGTPPRPADSTDGHLSAIAGTRADLTLRFNKPLDRLQVTGYGPTRDATAAGADGRSWRTTLRVDRPGQYRLLMHDRDGYAVESAAPMLIRVERDAPPTLAITRPGRDTRVAPDEAVDLVIVAQDDWGVGRMRLLGQVNSAPDTRVLGTWTPAAPDRRRHTVRLTVTPAEWDLEDGDQLRYWATAVDRNDVAAAPGRDQTRRYSLLVISPRQAAENLDAQLARFSRAIAELLELQRRNRAETAEHRPAGPLVERQVAIRGGTIDLAEQMQAQAFIARTIIADLRQLAAEPMPRVITLLEGYGQAGTLDAGRPLADQSLPVQDRIIAALQRIQQRLDRAEQTRQRLRRARKTDPDPARKVDQVLEKLAADLDAFLGDLKDIDEQYEKMPARRDGQDLTDEQLEELENIEHRLDRWKKWSADAVDGIMKLPDGFVPESHLAETFNMIFEEIEKQERAPTREIATPVEEGAKALAEEVAEDLEMWMPDAGDSKKWVMEDPVEGKFEVPETELPSNLQDMIGDLMEDVEDYDEQADDVTGAWGGNMQAGWAIDDGPISSYAARGKTGNMLPNASEMGGRSGSGRRGRSSGQMVGGESRALEGRPTPARVTDDPYESGTPEADKQLDPRGSTGGGKKTGGGQAGLQGFAPPDMVQDMQRLSEKQKLLREQTQKLARQMQTAGQPLTRVHRAIELMEGAEQDLRDLRYDDAARKRKAALGELRALDAGVDRAVSLSLQRAPYVPADLREQISTGSQQALPEGYEDIVGAYYRAISEKANE
mgnify:CR=1 FL=1